ncbi:MAG TPA: hypothetical protein VGB43_05930 [Flavobacterium sp.]|jgi:hypothetical protein
MRGLGLSELWVPGGTSVAGDRCPTQLVYMKAPERIKVSPELEAFMTHHDILSIGELLQNDDAVLLKMEGFGWRLMKEVLKLREI